MNEWRGIWKLTRPLTSLTGALTVLLGGYVAATGKVTTGVEGRIRRLGGN